MLAQWLPEQMDCNSLSSTRHTYRDYSPEM
jgi:hypothetical protein